MPKTKVKWKVAVFAMVVVGYLAAVCPAEIAEDGSAAPAEITVARSLTSGLSVPASGTVVLDFEDLPPADVGRLPSGYAGLEWDCYHEGDPRWWDWKSESVDPGYSQPHSGDDYLFNAFGENNLGFSLPNAGDRLSGAWFAKTRVTTPDRVRFNGYNSFGVLVQQSAWLTLSSTPQYLAANFAPVAWIEVEHSEWEAWYSMDDLTYETEPICTPPPEPNNPDPCDGALDVPVDTYLSWGEGCLASCDLPNGGFEDGIFAPWMTITGLGDQLTPWSVATGGTGYFRNGFPLEGAFFAQNGFDGDAGLFYDIYQEIAIPSCATFAVLNWSERIQWDLVGWGATLPREYVVSVQPAGGGAPLAILYTMSLNPGTRGDTGYVPHSVDLLNAAPGVAGQTIRINFHEEIPQTYTGPAQFDLDGVSLSCNGATALSGSADSLGQQKEYSSLRAAALASQNVEDPESTMPSSTTSPAGSVGSNQLNLPSANVGDLIGIDFDAGSGSPANWNYTTGGTAPIVLTNLVRENGTTSSVTATLASASAGFDNYVTAPNPATVPIHTPSLVAVGDYFWHRAQLTWNFTISNLVAGEEYNVYVFGLRGFEMNNNITISGGLPAIHFIQSDVTGGHLWVNGEIGDSGRELDSFAEVMTATASGEIVITVDKITNSQTIAGIAIEPAEDDCTTTWDVYLGTDPNVLELIPECNDICEPNCDPTPGTNETLDPGTAYYWQVVAENWCGETEGPIWSFTTGVVNQDPNCSDAVPSVTEIWPPHHKWVDIEILGVTDPDGDPVSITVTGITQDEPVAGQGSGNTVPDGDGIGTSVARVRIERSGLGNGRIYEISFEADDGMGGTCSGTVSVCVPHDRGQGAECIDDGQLYDSTASELLRADLNRDGIIDQLDFAIFANHWLVSYELDY